MGLRRSKIYRIVLPRRPEEGLKGQNWSAVTKKGCPAGKVDWDKIKGKLLTLAMALPWP